MGSNWVKEYFQLLRDQSLSGAKLYSVPSRVWSGHPRHLLSCNFCRLQDAFLPKARSAWSNPTARRRRSHLEVCKSCMTKVTRVCTLSMGQNIYVPLTSRARPGAPAGTGQRAWGPQWTPMDPPPESSQAHIGQITNKNTIPIWIVACRTRPSGWRSTVPCA